MNQQTTEEESVSLQTIKAALEVLRLVLRVRRKGVSADPFQDHGPASDFYSEHLAIYAHRAPDEGAHIPPNFVYTPLGFAAFWGKEFPDQFAINRGLSPFELLEMMNHCAAIIIESGADAAH